VSTKVEQSIVVNLPVNTVYNQWTQFEDFPQFMGGVKSVKQLSDDRLEWVAEIAGIRRQWEAKIVEQVPDRRVAWAATEGATNAGSVTFEEAATGQTHVHLSLEYEPEGLVEKIGDKLNVVENQAEGDLQRFKEFVESESYATGAWRGSINEGASVGNPGVEAAESSRGDSGKAGVSGKVAAGLGVAAAAAAATGIGLAAAAKGKDTEETEVPVVPEVPVETTPVVPVETTPVPPVSTTPVPPTTDLPATGASAGSASADIGERPLGQPFDQTNGLADTDGESDGTAESDTTSGAERGDRGIGGTNLPPNLAAGDVGGQH
jgi:uncharacterized membrane protein